MSKVSMGKVLLRNVIRHTDAHNKIQEESEMWKLRDLERQATSTHFPKHRGRMHCDRNLDDSEGSMRDRLGDRKDVMSERDERKAQYWTRKLYEFEANDPDRWGHSGFKELYPEEFHSDGKKACSDGKHRRKKHKNKLHDDIEKSSKKSSKKKKKKKEKKSSRRTVASGSEICSDAEDTARRKQRKGGKSKRRKKEHKDRTEDSSTEDSRSDIRTRTSRKRDCPEIDTLAEPQRKKRKNWKVANEERSEESSDA
ncbi:NKAP domain containing 1 isoform X1 [Rhinichthys klamathensis goyatoka]|uniref:NKAP domain containing 1 isoform X1 n=2 Tax=Rhinichthys klamathensis goyatoka TaxID=3034132 RepID=UPI0024B50374|nr:NKAP domain containing 1 isoform X1 [Rhinichthys klamathensis goyatoka]